MRADLRRPVLVAVALLGATAIVGGALAAGHAVTSHRTTTATPNVITACVRKEGDEQAANLRIVASAADCKKKESVLQWNIQGPQGAPGISVTTTALSVGNANCPTGGIQVTAVSGTSFVCNGPKGDPGVSVTTDQLAVGDANCPTGGVHIHAVSGDTYVCKGDTGAQGAPGPQGATGPPGPSGSATLTSPNGEYAVDITDHGIYLRGPSGTFFLNGFKIDKTTDPHFEG